ncbi:BTAD domain-containing putative transcriptional regulator [Corynebacterium pacaense]|uniref:BTAD domain-containing putative transcriptional regulator n=1 Tax=Corynebacterium pacaense TaxID=1816684 RepID=UPI0009BAA901|nr:BTAD domain-containing putative transcriptional regulator [Corynebacterium pacaense]
MNVRIRDLGPVEIVVDGEAIKLGKRPQAVLAVLLSRLNERVSVEALMEAVWGESAARGSQSTLESHIWRLRQLLEPGRDRTTPPTVLVTEPGGYRLVLAAEQADSLRFVSLAESSLALLRSDPVRALRQSTEALELWRGTPLGDAADAWWSAATVGRLVELHEQVRIRRVAGLLAVGEAEEAVVETGILIRELPLNEEVWAHRMLALYRVGRPDDALAAYRQARAAFLNELGLEPGTELRALHRRLLDRDEGLRGPTRRARQAPHTVVLPRRHNVLIGREAEVSALTSMLTTDQLVTIVGPAGCGKTSLAIEVARTVAPSFSDGVWFIDLASIDDADLVGELVASTLGISVGGSGDAVEQLRAYTSERQILLLLDNCEHLAESIHSLCGEILSSESSLHVVATSREPLALPGEILWPLSPLSTPEVAGASESSALKLFMARVREADPTLAIGQEERVCAVEICNALDGLPLALELAAARVRTASLDEVRRQVESNPGSLRRLGRGMREPVTLHAVIEGSYRLLSEPERLVHRRLSVLRGTITRRCAAEVAGFDPLSPEEVESILESLVNRCMLHVARSTEPGVESTFRQLATVRAHATITLEQSGERDDAVESRHRWLRAMLDRRPRSGHADAGGWYRTFDRDFGSVRESLETLLGDEPDAFAYFVLSRITNFWYYSARMIEAQRWLQTAIRVASPGDADPIDLAITTLSLAGNYEMAGRKDLAEPLLRAGMGNLCHVPGDRREDVADFLISTALTGALHNDFAMVADVGIRLRALADEGPADFALMAEAVECFAAMPHTPLQESIEMAIDIHRRAEDAGVLLAVWVCCIIGATLSVPYGDPESGLEWNRRMTTVQLLLGARLEAMPIEGQAYLMAASGRHREAVALFAASQEQSRRAGIGWPSRKYTQEFLDRSRAALGPEEAESAWSEGLVMTTAEALGLD